MVLMTVSYNDTSDLLFITLNISKIRDNYVNTRHIRIREGKTAVKNEHIV